MANDCLVTDAGNWLGVSSLDQILESFTPRRDSSVADDVEVETGGPIVAIVVVVTDRDAILQLRLAENLCHLCGRDEPTGPARLGSSRQELRQRGLGQLHQRGPDLLRRSFPARSNNVEIQHVRTADDD